MKPMATMLESYIPERRSLRYLDWLINSYLLPAATWYWDCCERSFKSSGNSRH